MHRKVRQAIVAPFWLVAGVVVLLLIGMVGLFESLLLQEEGARDFRDA